MQRVNHPQVKWPNVAIFLTGLLIVIADQLSKIWIRNNIPHGQSIFDIGFFEITHVRNTGAAFGLFQNHSLALIIIGIIGTIILLICTRFTGKDVPVLGTLPGQIALGLVLGGTVGNLIDRLHLGYVTDFINFGFWPAFNVADSAVTIGVIIFAYSLLRLGLSSQS